MENVTGSRPVKYKYKVGSPFNQCGPPNWKDKTIGGILHFVIL